MLQPAVRRAIIPMSRCIPNLAEGSRQMTDKKINTLKVDYDKYVKYRQGSKRVKSGDILFCPRGSLSKYTTVPKAYEHYVCIPQQTPKIKPIKYPGGEEFNPDIPCQQHKTLHCNTTKKRTSQTLAPSIPPPSI